MANKIDKKNEKAPTLWTIILDILLGRNQQDHATAQQLSLINKQFAKSGFGSYYNYLTQKVNAPCAQFFYDVYKIIVPLQMFFNDKLDIEASVSRIVHNYMSERQNEILEILDEQSLRNMASKMKYADFSAQVKKLLAEFHSEFDGDKCQSINNLYNSLIILRTFCCYDFYFMLRQFCPELEERDFKSKPRWEKMWGMYLSEPIANYESCEKALLKIQNWEELFAFMNEVNGGYIIDKGLLDKLLGMVAVHEQMPVFEMMCQLINKDVAFVIKGNSSTKDIVVDYLSKIDERTMCCLQDIYKEQRIDFIASEVKKMFPNGFSNSLKHYTNDNVALFESKKLAGYIYADAIAYLNEFLLEYIHREANSIASEVNVYGKTIDKEFVINMVNKCHELSDMGKRIETLDGKVSPQIALGYKIMGFLTQKSVSESDISSIRTQVDLINAEAEGIIKSSLKLLDELQDMFYKLYADYSNDPNVIISNWKELEHRVQKAYPPRLKALYDAIVQIRKLESNFQ